MMVGWLMETFSTSSNILHPTNVNPSDVRISTVFTWFARQANRARSHSHTNSATMPSMVKPSASAL